jgi:hypothetical protein
VCVCVCVCVAFVCSRLSLYIWVPSFLDPEDIKSLGAIWNFLKRQGCHELDLVMGKKGPVKGLCASGPQGLDPLLIHYSNSYM